MTSEDSPFDRYALPPLKGVTDAPADDDSVDDAPNAAPPAPVTSAFQDEVQFFSEADLQVEPVDEPAPADNEDQIEGSEPEAAEPEPEAAEPEPAAAEPEIAEPEIAESEALEPEVEEAAYFAVGYDEAPPVRRSRPRSPVADAANLVDVIETYAASAPPTAVGAHDDAEADAVVFASAASTLREDHEDDDRDRNDATQYLRPIPPPPIPPLNDPDEADDEALPDFLRPEALEAAFGIKPSDDEHMALLEPEPHLTTVIAEEAPATVVERPRPTVARTLAEIPVLLVVAALIAFLVKTFLAQAYYIPSGSMLPQLQIDDRVVVSKLAFKLHDPRRGDIVVFDDPRPNVAPTEAARTGFQKWVRKVGEGIGVVQPSTDEFIKRVIGLPGEKVAGHDGFVFINGHKLLEPYLPNGVETTDFPAQTVAQGRLWVMGDNRGGSADSRVFGQIKIDSIVGRAVVKVWPFDHISFL